MSLHFDVDKIDNISTTKWLFALQTNKGEIKQIIKKSEYEYISTITSAFNHINVIQGIYPAEKDVRKVVTYFQLPILFGNESNFQPCVV